MDSDENRIALLENGPLQTQEKIEDLYWSSLSRAPTDAEYAPLMKYLEADPGPSRQRLQDILWGLLNAKEFALRY